MTRNDRAKGQSTIEFTFAMIVIVFLIFGMIMVFRWAGMDLANRRVVQDQTLALPLNSDLSDPVYQLQATADSTFMPMGAMYHGKITDGSSSQ